MATRKRKQSDFCKSESGSYDRSVTLLPMDLMIEIMGYIASSSFVDLFNSKLCCKEFMAVTEDDCIFRRVSISEDKFPVVPWHVDEKSVAFLQRCMECGNPEALFREGMTDYFSRKKVENGLENLKRAAEKGHVEASYVYGIILLCMGGKSNRKLGLEILKYVKASSRSSSRRKSTVGDCRKRVKSIIRQMWVNNSLDPKRQLEKRTCTSINTANLSLPPQQPLVGRRMMTWNMTWIVKLVLGAVKL